MRRLVCATAAVLLVAGLAGCGSSDDRTTGAASSAQSSSAPATSSTQGGNALFADMTTAMAKAGSARVRFTTAVGSAGIDGSGSFRFGKRLAADLSVRVPGQGQVGVVLLPDAFYLKLPASAGLPDGKPWLKIGAGGDDPVGQAFGPLLDQLRQSFDPGSNVALLKATTTLRPSGHEDLDGVTTTKYAATVDLAKAAGAADGALAEQYRALARQGVTRLHYAIWVDRDSLPHKFTTTVPTKQGDVKATGRYSDWGAPVSIKAPRPSQVADPSQLGGPGMPTAPTAG